MSEDNINLSGLPVYEQWNEDSVSGYSKYFRDGRAIVPVKKIGVPQGNRNMRDERGEPKDINYSELYNYYRADGNIQELFSTRGDLTVAYGYDFELPKPLDQDLQEADKTVLENMDLWRDWVGLDEFIKQIVVSLFVYGDFFAEKVYDANGELSNDSWGIKKLKILDPRTIFVDRRADGKINKYYQHPKADQIQPRSIVNSNKSIPLPPEQVVHIKMDDFMNKTYGQSRLFAQLDNIDMKTEIKLNAVTIAQQRASPFLVWSIGAPDKIFPPTLIEEIRQNLEGQLINVNDSDVFVPGFITVNAVGGDSNAGVNLLPMLEYFNEEMAEAAGIPNFGQTDGGADVKNELLVRRTKYLQNFIGNELRNQVFKDLIYQPRKEGNSVRSGRIVAKELTPLDYKNVPHIKWRVIESVADHRLRMGELTESGLLGEEEGRKQLGLRGKLTDEQQTIKNRVKIKEADSKEKLAEAQEKMAEQRPPSFTNPTPRVSEARTPNDVRDR